MLGCGYGTLRRFHLHYNGEWREDAFLGGTLVERKKAERYQHIILAVSKRKKWVVRDALQDNAWVRKIKPSINLSITHIVEFVDLWICLEQFQLQPGIDDDISWKLEANKEYSAAYAYRA